MKVTIGPYRDFIGPYQIAEKILFWIPKYTKDYDYNPAYDKVNELGFWLAGGKKKDSWLLTFCEWLYTERKRKVKIRIDPYDTWNMDSTLAHIILPMLKQLKATQHGAAKVKLEDVPEHLRYNTKETPGQYTFAFYDEGENTIAEDPTFKRWNWVLDEMIFAFENLEEDWMDEFRIPRVTASTYFDHDYTYDWDKVKVVEARITNGFRLFGAYYRNLWD